MENDVAGNLKLRCDRFDLVAVHIGTAVAKPFPEETDWRQEFCGEGSARLLIPRPRRCSQPRRRILRRPRQEGSARGGKLSVRERQTGKGYAGEVVVLARHRSGNYRKLR